MTEGATVGRRRFTRALIALGLVVALALVALLVLARALEPYVIREARARGVVLTVEHVGLGFGGVRLGGACFQLEGVRGLTGCADVLVVALDGLSPRAIEAEGLRLDVRGTHAFGDLVIWNERYREAGSLPSSAAGARLSFSDGEGGVTRVELEGAALRVAPGAGTLRGGRGRMSIGDGRSPGDLGTVSAEWSIDKRSFAVGFLGSRDAPEPVRLELQAREHVVAAALTIDPVPLETIAGALGIAVGGPRVGVSGTATLETARGDEARPLTGALSLRLAGYVPPHPKELDGIVFGTGTDVSGNVTIPADRASMSLDDLKVVAGALALKGSGRGVRDGEGARLSADLSGSLACTQLAASAIGAHLGKNALGRLAAGFAKRALSGSVAVRLHVEADSRKIEAARIEPHALIKCRVGG